MLPLCLNTNRGASVYVVVYSFFSRVNVVEVDFII